MNGLIKNDSEIIAFVLCCFMSGSIDSAELRAWGMKVIENMEDYPLYLLDLIDFDDPRFHIYEIIGFIPDDAISKNGRRTIDQLALYRKNILPDSMTRKDATRKDWIDIDTVQKFNKIFKDILDPIPISGAPTRP
jgi:hypothetical protein